jgi:hypothetical protein
MSNPGGTVATEAGHWYKPDGTPFYTVVGRNGEERSTTLRDARKVGAGPSVTGIIRAAGTPYQLMSYFINQTLLAGASIPRDPLEGDQAWMERVYAKSKEHSETARDAGTAIHGEIEKALVDTVWIPGPEAHAAIQTLGEWCGLDGLRPERSFFHPLGYGGKCDVHKKPEITLEETHNGYVADFKSKDFTEGDLPRTYENHAMQLAAYREGFDMPLARCAIIYVSTSVPGLTHLVELEEKELQRGWEMFCALLQYWQLKNRYVPTCELAKELA